MLDAVGLEERLDGADLVITGEGQIDASTVFNKAPVGVARLARQRGIPVFGLAGSLGKGYEEVHNLGIDAVFTLVDRPMTLDEALGDTESARRIVGGGSNQGFCRRSEGAVIPYPTSTM